VREGRWEGGREGGKKEMEGRRGRKRQDVFALQRPQPNAGSPSLPLSLPPSLPPFLSNRRSIQRRPPSSFEGRRARSAARPRAGGRTRRRTRVRCVTTQLLLADIQRNSLPSPLPSTLPQIILPPSLPSSLPSSLPLSDDDGGINVDEEGGREGGAGLAMPKTLDEDQWVACDKCVFSPPMLPPSLPPFLPPFFLPLPNRSIEES